MLYPLQFRPLFVEKMWGGRKLQTFLGKALPAGKPIGESWELYDFPPGVVGRSADWVSSVVINGHLAGRTLHELMESRGRELLGDAAPVMSEVGSQFPLLVKFLDAREDLSIQVHPDRAYAAAHRGAHLKNEAWYILQADPGARLLKGLRPGTTAEQFRTALRDGSIEAMVESIPAKPGDCHYLPSGTVHALGAGILAAEVQTPSDTTYRVFDFNRVDPSTGKPRTLHVEQAMDCIDFAAKPVATEPRNDGKLASCEQFAIAQRELRPGDYRNISGGRIGIWIMLEGNAEMIGEEETIALQAGGTILLPAEMANRQLRTDTGCAWLEVSVPVIRSDD